MIGVGGRNRAVRGPELGERIGVGFAVGEGGPGFVSHHRLDPGLSLVAVAGPVAVRIVGVGGEKEGFVFVFGPFQKSAGEGKEAGRIAPHPGLVVLPVGGQAETAPLGTVLADHAGEVPGVEQERGDGSSLGRPTLPPATRRGLNPMTEKARALGMESGVQGLAGWSANRRGHVCPLDQQAFPGEAVEVGGESGQGVAHASEGVPTQVVGGEHENVGALAHKVDSAGQENGERNKQTKDELIRIHGAGWFPCRTTSRPGSPRRRRRRGRRRRPGR